MIPHKWKWCSIFLIMLGLTNLSFFQPALRTAQAAAVADIQLISDQETTGQGGIMGFHILYHNLLDASIPTADIQVKVPDGLDIQNAGGAQWDADLRVLRWNLIDLAAQAGAAVSFSLKAGNDIQTGSVFELSAGMEVSGSLLAQTPGVKVPVGTETHQPFFVGYPDGQFHPKSNLTRAETAAVVARIKNLTDQSLPALPYSDVPQHHWAYHYIYEVTNAGYMSGYQGKFRPDEPITRAELVSLILQLRGIHAVPLSGFADTAGHWAEDIIGTAKSLGLIDGIGRNLFEPDQYIERQSAAKLIDVGLFRGELKDGDVPVIQHFPDIPPDLWSFGWVEEASSVAHESVHQNIGEESLIRYLPEQTESF